MRGGHKIVVPPPDRPDHADEPGQVEHRPPVAPVQHERYQRGRDDPANRRPGVDDAHGRRSLVHGKPLGDGACGRRKATAFAHAEQQTAHGQHRHARRQTMARARQRPEQHDRQETRTGPDDIHQPAATGVHQRVRDQEARLQERELRVGDGDVLLDGLDRHRQRLPIEIADGDGRADQAGDAPAQHQVPVSLDRSAVTMWRCEPRCTTGPGA